MIPMELYELLNNAAVKFEVIEIFDGVRVLSIHVEEEDVDEGTD